MSLILEALKKSEAERRAGELPVVLSERAYVPHRERPIWPVFAAFVALVGMAGVYVNRSILWPERFPPEPDATTPANAQALPEGSFALTGDQAEAVAADTGPEATPAAIAATTSTPSNGRTGSQDPAAAAGATPIPAPVAAAPLAAAPVAAAPAAPAFPGPELVAAPEPAALANPSNDPPPSYPTPSPSMQSAAASAEPPVPSAITPPPAAMPVPEIAAAEPGPTQAPAEAVPSADALPEFRSLPYATRQAIPVLKVSLFVFHQDPNRRFVIVNGARLQEGGVVGEETWLREIRQDGAVFEFRGQRFLLTRQGG